MSDPRKNVLLFGGSATPLHNTWEILLFGGSDTPLHNTWEESEQHRFQLSFQQNQLVHIHKLCVLQSFYQWRKTRKLRESSRGFLFRGSIATVDIRAKSPECNNQRQDLETTHRIMQQYHSSNASDRYSYSVKDTSQDSG